MRIRALAPDLALAAVVALVGLFPHAWFSAQMGAREAFKDATGEDAAVVEGVLDGAVARDRVLSATTLRLLWRVSGGGVERTLVAADVVAPAGLALAAAYLLRPVLGAPVPRMAAVLALLLATELLSLAGGAVWGPSVPGRALWVRLPVIALAPPPTFGTTFLMLYRAVEPAVSWTLACLVLGGLVRQLGEDPPEAGGPAARRRWIGVLASNALLPFAHFPVAVSLAVAETALALVLLAGGRRLRSRAALAVAGAAAALAALGAALLADGPRTTAESVFRSRALLLSPALVLGAIGCAVLVERAYRRGLAPREAVALACLATPVVVNTQQLLTGLTLGSVAFEWGSDYLFVAAGGLLAVDWRAVPAGAGGRGVAGLALAALVALAGQGRLRTCATFEGENLRSVIEARALAAAIAAGVRAPRVLLENPYDDALLAIRLGGPLAAVMGGRDFPWLGVTGWSARFVPRGPAAQRVFEQYARLETTPAEVERLVPRIQRVSRDNGNPEGFLGGYAAALARPPAAWAEPVIYLTPAGPGAVSLGRRFDHQLVAQLAGVAGQTTARVYAYLQTARARPLDDPAAALLATLRARGQALALVDEPDGHSVRRPVAAAPAVARLPDRLWRPARGVSVERRSEGLDVTTPPLRSAFAVNTLPIRAAERGHHVFVLAGRSISGRAALRLLAGQAVRYWAFGRLSAPRRDGSVLWVVEADLEAGAEVSLFLLNDHPAGDYASALLVGELRAFLWPPAGPAPVSRAPGA